MVVFDIIVMISGYVIALLINLSWSLFVDKMNHSWCQTCIDECEDWYRRNIELIEEFYGDEDEEEKEGEE